MNSVASVLIRKSKGEVSRHLLQRIKEKRFNAEELTNHARKLCGAETLAHVSLAGAAIGMLLGIFPLVTTATVVVLVAVTVELLRSRQKLYPDALLALVMSGGLALAVVLLSMTRGFNVDVMSYLFGSILTVTQLDLLIIIAVGLVMNNPGGFTPPFRS